MLSIPLIFFIHILKTSRYSIRVGRSEDPRGPFVDKSGKDLTDGGGEIVYGSSGETYAPGGQGVIRVGDTDVLYYHYRENTPVFKPNDRILTPPENKTVGVAFSVSFHHGRLVDRDTRVYICPCRSSFIPFDLQRNCLTLYLQDAFLGFNPLKYVNGWPIALA